MYHQVSDTKPYVLPADELYYVFRFISVIKLGYFLIEH